MIQLDINGKRHNVDVPGETPLLWTLRDEMGFTGTKFGGGMALCGACTVHVDGQPVRSCLAPIASLANRKITTIEAIGSDRIGKALQAAWIDLGVPQCGYCQSGQIMSAAALLLPKGRGLSIAAHYSFVSYVAAVVEVAVDDQGQVTIPRVDIAVDCGATVNPDRVIAQMEGACVMGVGVAMTGEITFKDGRAVQKNFDGYEVTRMAGAPREIRVHIVPGDYSQPLGGVGEPGVPPIPPALCNAIFAATGKRSRRLPIRDQLKG
jgi:CO/xanthine dehydrogenase Mo-binding subunit